VHYLWLIPVGFVVGVFGTLIGAGGGFVLMPFLLLLYPHDSPEALTSISLAVVFLNALSGSAAYARLKRIDYKSGLLFAGATVPGSILGALTTTWIPRRLFDVVFGLLMCALAAMLIKRPTPPRDAPPRPSRCSVTRVLRDAAGGEVTYTFNPITGVVLSLFVGLFSSLLGIGGGIIHVPALVQLLCFPVHTATATSHFVLAIMALTGTAVHAATGVLSQGLTRALALGVGVLFGAQLGARLSTRVRGDWIIRALALALASVGIRVLFQAF
jgi:uncharacterized protein